MRSADSIASTSRSNEISFSRTSPRRALMSMSTATPPRCSRRSRRRADPRRRPRLVDLVGLVSALAVELDLDPGPGDLAERQPPGGGLAPLHARDLQVEAVVVHPGDTGRQLAARGQLRLDQPAGVAREVPGQGQRPVGAGRGDLKDVRGTAHRRRWRRALRRPPGSAAATVSSCTPSSESTTTRSTRRLPAGVTAISSRSSSLGDGERLQQPSQPVALGGAHPGDSSAACAVVDPSRIGPEPIGSGT